MGRKALWAAGAVVLASLSIARGGNPYLTDDPYVPELRWEFNFGAAYQSVTTGNALAGPILDLNYSLVRRTVQLTTRLSGLAVWPDDGPAQSGLADTSAEVKWNFLKEPTKGWVPSIAIKPGLVIPTGAGSRGLGEDVWSLNVPMEIGKTFGSWVLYGELGCRFALTEDGDDDVIYGVAVQHDLTKKLNIGAEINGLASRGPLHDDLLVANVGFIYVINKQTDLQFTIGRSLRGDNDANPQLLLQFFVQFAF